VSSGSVYPCVIILTCVTRIIVIVALGQLFPIIVLI
jgi:hypothetical protein